MPKLLGKQLTKDQLSQIDNMMRRWRMESRELYKKIESALRDKLTRNPREVIRILRVLSEDVNKQLEEMKAYKKANTNRSVDDAIAETMELIDSIDATVGSVDMFANSEAGASDTAEVLYDMYEKLRAHAKSVEGFKILKAVTDMVSDASAVNDAPKGDKINIIDFAKSLKLAYKEGEYQKLVTKAPRKDRVKYHTLFRFPVVPLMVARPKVADFKGIIEVDPVIFQDAQGKMRARYMIMKNQMLMAVNLRWIQNKAKAKGWGDQEIAEYMQQEMDDLVSHAAPIAGGFGVSKRERLLRQKLITYKHGSHRRAPGLIFFWFANVRTANNMLSKMRRVRDWTLAIP